MTSDAKARTIRIIAVALATRLHLDGKTRRPGPASVICMMPQIVSGGETAVNHLRSDNICEFRNPRSEACQSRDAFRFDALIHFAGSEILILFHPSAGPLDHDAIDAIALAQTEGDRQF